MTGRAFRRALTGIVGDEAPAVVHAHHPHEVGRAALHAARARGVPFVYELRCFNGDYDLDSPRLSKRLRGRRVNALELDVARRADAVVTISDGLADRLRAGGVAADRIHIVRNAVDTDRFATAPARTDGAGDLHVGYATTFEAMENLDGLVEAVALLRKRRPGLRLRATLMGTGRDFDRIEGLVARAGLNDVIDLPGFVPYSQMPDRLGALDLFVVPRRAAAVSSGTTPLKPLEALSVGLPVLSSDLPALRELMGHSPAARFVPPTPEGLAQGIERFADAPWPRSEGIEARSWRREVHRYADVYAAAGARP
ncbi:glycosyltransferase [Citreimonas sp.]|uniref:glycosyltransferase n=1 Tax=Citreimonas sp. TaxID=3036715 RepID=UPI0035C82729